MSRAITPEHFPWFDYRRYSFSLGIDHGHSAYLSGHSASEYDTDEARIVVRGDIAAQAETAYAKAERILEAAGYSLANVVHVVENVTVDGIDQYEAAARVREDVFGAASPAVSTVVVRRLLRPSALIEVEVTASHAVGAGRHVGPGPGVAGRWLRRAGNLVYLPTVHPHDEHGALVGEGDPVAQVRQIFQNARQMLMAMGLDTDRVVKTTEMIHPDALVDYKSTASVRKEYLGPVYPASAGILQPRVAADPRVLISYDFVAATEPATVINPGWDRYAKLTYSPAVTVGDVVFLSGQAALDPETEQAVHPRDVAAQAEYTYGNVIAVLDAAGLGPEHLVRTVEYVTPGGLPRYREVAEVRRRLLRDPWPASTGIVCHALLRPEFEFEVDPTAMQPVVAR